MSINIFTLMDIWQKLILLLGHCQKSPSYLIIQNFMKKDILILQRDKCHIRCGDKYKLSFFSTTGSLPQVRNIFFCFKIAIGQH